jgi:hypothetical protein
MPADIAAAEYENTILKLETDGNASAPNVAEALQLSQDMQCKKRMDVGTTLEADLASLVVAGYEILDCPDLFLQSSDFRRGQAAAEVGLVM